MVGGVSAIQRIMEAPALPKMPYTLDQILRCKDYTEEELQKDFANLVDFKATTNPRKWAGNKIIYHAQLRNMLKCRRGNKGYQTMEEIFADPTKRDKLWASTIQRNRRKKATIPSEVDVYECHRLNGGAIVSFKATTAKYIYKRYNAHYVLDPCAGWGGRALGLEALAATGSVEHRSYTGYDTNIEMREAYEEIVRIAEESPWGMESEFDMRWMSCLDGDFTDKEYDIVLTSPPYGNMELYEHMRPWKDDKDFTDTFMVPLMLKLFRETNCPICINISPKLYKLLTTERPLKDSPKFGKGIPYIRECDEKIDLRQQMGQQFKTKSQDYIYVWKPQLPEGQPPYDYIYDDPPEDVDPETGEVNPNMVYSPKKPDNDDYLLC